MHFAPDRDPMDVPPPPTADEVARAFTVPVMTLAPQDAITEAGIGTVGESSNGGPTVLVEVALSYTFWRNPADHGDPVNLADLDDERRRSLETEPPRPLPPWMLERRALMRLPMLWEAVQTRLVRPDTNSATMATALAAHVNHLLMNTFRDERVVGDSPGTLDAPVSERHVEATFVTVDGTEVEGLKLDTDPHVVGVGADLGDRLVTAVVSRDFAPHLDLAFETRPLPS